MCKSYTHHATKRRTVSPKGSEKSLLCWSSLSKGIKTRPANELAAVLKQPAKLWKTSTEKKRKNFKITLKSRCFKYYKKNLYRKSWNCKIYYASSRERETLLKLQIMTTIPSDRNPNGIRNDKIKSRDCRRIIISAQPNKLVGES